MEEDLIASLTRQVKEDVIQNYLTERRLVELQMEDIAEQTESLRQRSRKAGRRLNRLALLMVDPELLGRLVTLLQIPQPSYWVTCLDPKYSKGIRFIRVRALTDKSRFRKLLLEAYNRFYQWMEKYRQGYENLAGECAAVNMNVAAFQKNFDLLAILSFLKNLDTATVERKRYLGENFTPEEIASVDQKLYLRPIDFTKLDIPEPVSLPKPETVEHPLGDLSQEVYRKHRAHVKRLMV